MAKNTIYSLGFILTLILGVFTSCEKEKEEDVQPTALEFTAFSFEEVSDAVGEIDGLKITVPVPYETDVTALTPVAEYTEGATVIPNLETADFTNPVTYVLKKGDETKSYTVTVEKLDPTSIVVSELTVETAQEVSIDDNANEISITFLEGQDVSAVAYEATTFPEGAATAPEVLDLTIEEPTLTVSVGETTKTYAIKVVFVTPGFSDYKVLYVNSQDEGNFDFPFADDNNQRAMAMSGENIYVYEKGKNTIYYLSTDALGIGFQVDNAVNMEGVSGGTFAIGGLQTSGSTLLACNMVMNSAGDWKIYKWNDIAEAPEVILTYPNTRGRFETFKVEGDVNGDGAILAVPFGDGKEIYKFNISGGAVSTTPEIINLSVPVTFGNYANAVMAKDEYIVTGANVPPYAFDNAGAELAKVASDAIGNRTISTNYFTFRGADYMVLLEAQDGGAKNQYLHIYDVTGVPSEALGNINADNVEGVHKVSHLIGNMTNANVAGATSVVVNEDHVLVSAMSTNNGMVTIELK